MVRNECYRDQKRRCGQNCKAYQPTGKDEEVCLILRWYAVATHVMRW
jgi:hypothetical protein